MKEALISQHESTQLHQHCPERKTFEGRLISGVLKTSEKCFSVEICTGRKLDTKSLPQLGLDFCSVIWHNTPRELKCVEEIPAVKLARRLSCQGHNVLLHLAGRNLRKCHVLKILNVVKGVGVRNIFALQGDPSQIIEKDDSKCDFPYAIDLVKFVRLHYGNYFCIGVAGYPDKHPLSKDRKEEISYLKEKVSSGADFIITQASYKYESFVNFFKLCRNSGIQVPIIPGIFIISSHKNLLATSKFCGVPIPAEIQVVADENKDNCKAIREFGVRHATEMVKSVLNDTEHLFSGVHIFCMNDLKFVREVLDRVGLFKSRLEYPK